MQGTILAWVAVRLSRRAAELTSVSASAAEPTNNPAVKKLRAAWLQKKAEIFAGKLTKPDAEDPDTVNHLNWYLSTGFQRTYPGEKTVRLPSDFNNPAPTTADVDD